PVFSNARITELRPKVAAIAAGLVDRLIAQDGGDLVTDYAIPLSVGTLAEFTGLPRADSGKWVAWIRQMFDVYDRAGAAQASAEFGRYIDELIAAHRREPCGDFISMLIESEVDGHRLTDKELHSFCTVLFGAGFETTADAMSVMLYYLAERPVEYQQLAAQPQLISSAVEEFLRYISPIQIFGRNATQQIELHGQTIRPRDVVALSFGSANHDPKVFSDPEWCVLDRTPNPHVAFGAGIHLCLGAPVARLEMQVTLEEFTRRVPEYHLAPQTIVAWKTRGDRRGLAALPVVLTS
ncbi:MAG TPA: cytochrome P450, partial [Anaerolineae bacterium]|nr:cytochrome P450 [Anaerolineae bacterium]